MINDLLKLREAVELYVSMSISSGKAMEKKDKNKLLECQLKEEDWEELITMHGILYSFWELTLSMQGNIATQIREEIGDEMPETVYGKPNASHLQ